MTLEMRNAGRGHYCGLHNHAVLQVVRAVLIQFLWNVSGSILIRRVGVRPRWRARAAASRGARARLRPPESCRHSRLEVHRWSWVNKCDCTQPGWVS